MTHIPVLLHESIDGLNLKESDIFVDGTVGGGGHIEEVVKRFGDKVKIIGIDLDAAAISRAKARIASLPSDINFFQESFRNIDVVLKDMKVNAILLDIGLSSNQFEESGRGFSFQKDEPLLMTFKEDVAEDDLTARDIVNTWDEENIKIILEGYGEEGFAYKIAKVIVERRKEKPILSTFDLVEVIRRATPDFYHHQRIHPATKTFQALRIAVNDELNALKEGIAKGFESMLSSGRIAVISFHSLEDRIVKQFFKDMEDRGLGKRITKKPVTPSEGEIGENPRSRSAKLRIIEKI